MQVLHNIDIYQVDEFTPEVKIASYDTEEEANIELEKIEKESIKYDMFTCFFIKKENIE